MHLETDNFFITFEYAVAFELYSDGKDTSFFLKVPILHFNALFVVIRLKIWGKFLFLLNGSYQSATNCFNIMSEQNCRFDVPKLKNQIREASPLLFMVLLFDFRFFCSF